MRIVDIQNSNCFSHTGSVVTSCSPAMHVFLLAVITLSATTLYAQSGVADSAKPDQLALPVDSATAEELPRPKDSKLIAPTVEKSSPETKGTPGGGDEPFPAAVELKGIMTVHGQTIALLYVAQRPIMLTEGRPTVIPGMKNIQFTIRRLHESNNLEIVIPEKQTVVVGFGSPYQPSE